MRKLLFILLASFCVFAVHGQSAQGRYISRQAEKGTMYFVMPKKLKDLSGLKSFEYDMTLLTKTDSVTINFTYESASMDVPADLAIEAGDKIFKCTDYKPLFIDVKKNRYEVRITSKFSNNVLDSVVNSVTPPVFRFLQANEAKSATYKAGAWRDDRKKLKDIFKLYQYTK